MNHQSALSQLGLSLVDSLNKVEAYEQARNSRRERDTVHIQTVGSGLSTAYEQLRNASEYAEDELLQQRAIRRYLKRELSFHVESETNHLAKELVTELTQAEYLANDHITNSELKAISSDIKKYYKSYWEYAKNEPNVGKRTQFQNWVLDVLSVKCEQTLHSHIRQLMFAHFAFTYLQDKIQIKKLIRDNEAIEEEDYPLVLYIAIHRAILKSDLMTIRAALLDSYRKDVSDLHEFVAFNKKIDFLSSTKNVAYTSRIIGKNGASLRFIYSGFYAEDAPVTKEALRTPDTLEHVLRKHIEQEYIQLNRRLDKGIIRSIIFLLITKSLVGLGIEIPYDILLEGTILWVPLLINLLFPALFITASRLTLSTPVPRNTEAIINQITDIIFKNDRPAPSIRIPKESTSIGFNIAYSVLFLLVFAGLSYILYLLHFNIVQGVIFFIFLSTASFLAFRLSRQIHEIEVVHTQQGTLSLIRDIIYMPFIYVGQQISYRYSQVNIVANVLDILIELPLKTTLRLVRQWMSFLNAKKDELI